MGSRRTADCTAAQEELEMLIAITREVSAGINQCELTHLERQPIDVEAARRQHHNYETLLAELGCQVHCLPEEPQLPDSVFVEDAALVLDEVAIITNPARPQDDPKPRALPTRLPPIARSSPLSHQALLTVATFCASTGPSTSVCRAAAIVKPSNRCNERSLVLDIAFRAWR